MKELSAIKIVPQSSCLYPRYKRIRDAYTNEDKVICYGCGKCWNCIQSFRESWRIRLEQSMIYSAYKEPKGFIYDTFTVSNSSLPSFSAHDYFTGESVVLDDFIHDDNVWKTIDHYGGRVPFLSKESFSYFIKRGRESYNSFYKKEIKAGVRPRCPLKIFAALEYGPLWSRPHVHIAAFGVNYKDWCKFWAKPWRKEMGFTKTKPILLRDKGKEFHEHCSRNARYISKYLLKGSYESVLVRAGIVPKAWRVISHGIGSELLDYDSRFDWLQNDILYRMANRISVDSNKNSKLFQDSCEYVDKICASLSQEHINSLKLFVQNGYKFALPRYYRDRLCFSHSKGLAGSAIKSALYENALDDCFEEILQYATDCNFFPGKSREWVRYHLEHDSRALNIASFRYRAHKKIQGIRKAEWNRLSTLNTLNRLRSKSKSGDLGLLL